MPMNFDEFKKHLEKTYKKSTDGSNVFYVDLNEPKDEQPEKKINKFQFLNEE